jgi:hypothetical protein
MTEKKFELNKENIEKIRQYYDNKGMLWLVAAAVEGSIGYYYPKAAENLIKSTLEGKIWVSERCAACYKGDQTVEILSDIRHFEWLEKEHPEKAKAIIELVKKMYDMDWLEATTIGCLYPTLV